jgi:hypothetical protein
MPSQGVIVDIKLPSGCLDRGTGRQKSLDAHAFGVITALAAASGSPLLSRHLCPREYALIQIQSKQKIVPRKRY